MRTIQILLQLINSIQTNSLTVSRLPWADIRLCILTELELCAALYTKAQFQQTVQLFNELINEAEQDSLECNANSVISLLQKVIFGLHLLPESEHTDKILQQANFDHACLDHHRNNTIIVLGDSHVNFFSGNETLSFLPIGEKINTCENLHFSWFTPLHIGPCLAYNCNRFQTTYSFREKVEYLCQNFIKPHAKILCCLGEIDLRVHVFKQTKLQNKTYQQIVDDILEQYLQFLLRLQKSDYQVSCWGPIASQKESCPLDPNFPRNGSETDRNLATAYFNQKLSDLCQAHNILFLSIFEQMVTPDYQTRDEYLSIDHCHLGQSALPLALSEWEKLF